MPETDGRPVDGVSKPAHKLPDQFARAGEASVAWDVLYGARLGTFRQLAKRDEVDYRWLQDLSVVGARALLRALRGHALQI